VPGKGCGCSYSAAAMPAGRPSLQEVHRSQLGSDADSMWAAASVEQQAGQDTEMCISGNLPRMAGTSRTFLTETGTEL
jgi:hypothetical protein